MERTPPGHPRPRRAPIARLRGTKVPYADLGPQDLDHLERRLDQLLATIEGRSRIPDRFEAALARALKAKPRERSDARFRHVRSVEEFAEAATLPQPPQSFRGMSATYREAIAGLCRSGEQFRLLRLTSQLGLETRSFSDTDVAIALSGGGAKGAFEAGVLLFLESSGVLQTDVKLVCGTSAGALNALATSAWGANAGTRVSAIWLSLRSNTDMFRPSLQYQEILSILDELGVSLDQSSSGSSVDWNWIRVGTAIPVIGNILALAVESEVEEKLDLLERLVDRVLALSSVNSLAPTRSVLNLALPKPLSTMLPLRIVTVSAQDGHVYVVDESADVRELDPRQPREQLGVFHLLGEDVRDALVRAAMASASIPIIFGSETLLVSGASGIKTLDDLRSAIENHETHALSQVRIFQAWDGGLRDNLPLQAALDAGARKVLAVSASARGLAEASGFSSSPAGLIASLARTIEVLVDEVGESDRLHALGGADVTFIDPSVALNSTDQVDPGLIRMNLEHGYMRAHDRLAGLPPEIADLLQNGGTIGALLFVLWAAEALLSTDEITSLRKEIWELEGSGFRKVYGMWAWDPTALHALRGKKAELFDLYQARIDAWGTLDCVPDPLPDGTPLSNAWLRWERRSSPAGDRLLLTQGPFERQLIFAPLPTWEPAGGVPPAPGPLDAP